jgi:hypothetical protein
VNLTLCKDAADEIERLREQLAKLRETAASMNFSPRVIEAPSPIAA